jgi:hypothetical protein
MEKEFIPMDLALKLKALGFDEPCFGFYSTIYDLIIGRTNGKKSLFDSECLAPTFSQAFRWFREKYGLKFYIRQDIWNHWCSIIMISKDGEYVSIGEYKTYEEAELTCLTKLIEIVENEKTL